MSQPFDPAMLPIHRSRDAVLATLTRSNRVVVVAPTGSGKSTQLPKILLENGLIHGDIVVLEPRRIAARMLATRVATELGEQVGGLVGYETRHDRKISNATRVRFVTDGLFVRQMQADPSLSRVGCVILDEFHERSVAVDVALGLVKSLQESTRKDLRMIVTSATLEANRLAACLECDVIEAHGRAYDVDVSYLAKPSRDPCWELAGNALEQVLDRLTRGEGDDPGHTLMFMPGVFEILKATERVKIALARTGVECEVLPLHGSLTPQEQDRAVSNADPQRQRRIIIATNVAETSLTIPHVRTVIDTGLARVHRYDALRGIDTLRVETISKSSAEQRAGRAGRTASGRAYRLWSKAEHERRDANTAPEVARIDLCATMLETMSLGVLDPLHFAWLDAPDLGRFEEARRTLTVLGALDAHGKLTAIGESMARLPTHPRLARALVEAQRLGCATRVARIAASMSDRDPAEGMHASALHGLLDADDSFSDALVREKLIGAVESRGLPHGADALACREAALVAAQFERALSRLPRGGRDDSNDAVSAALLAGFVDRIAFKHERERTHCAMQTRRKVELAKDSIVRAQGFLLALEIRESGPEHDRLVSIPIAHPVPQTLIEQALPEQFSTRIGTQWNAELRAVECAEEQLFAEIVIARKSRNPTPSPAVEAELLARIKSGDIKFEDWETHSEPWITRVRCVAQWFPERALLTYADDDLDILRAELVTGCVRAREVECKSSLDALRSALNWDDQQFIEKVAPASIALPSGRKMKLDYEVGASPRGRSKIQDFYGLDETPKVANGRVPITLEILGPNLRPLQVTQDLGNFWKVLYPEMRNALRRRYPRHDWR